MLPPEWFDRHLYEYLELCGKLDESIIKDVVRRIGKMGAITDASKWQIRKLRESGLLYDDIIKQVAKFSDTSEKEVRQLFEDAGIESLKWDDEIYESAGLSPIPLKQSPALLRILDAGMKKTNNVVHNFTMTTASAWQNTFINACDLAYMQVSSGAFDYHTAIRNAVKSCINQGTEVVYPTGHKDKLDVAMRRATLTGVNQTMGKLQIGQAEEMGCDLVETTAHAGARPSHAEWQGKVFSLSGKSSKYPPFEESTGYGTGAGLCGWNCRHSFYPFVEGASQAAYTRSELNRLQNETVTYRDQEIPMYEATQIQRKMERDIRDTRRKLSGYNEAAKNGIDMTEDFAKESVKLKQQEAVLKDFCRQTNLYRDTNRYQVLGFDKSVSQKAVHKAKQNYQNWLKEINAQKCAENLIVKALQKDKVITPVLRKAAAQGEGHLEGLNYRIKGRDSLVRKLISKSKQKSLSVEEYSEKVTDVLRYTNVSATDNLAKDYTAMVEFLGQKGYNVIKVNNTFQANGPYRGINTLVTDQSGYVFELQYHTPESLRVKEMNHKLYEEQRLDSTSNRRKQELNDQMAHNAESVPVPKNIDKIK